MRIQRQTLLVAVLVLSGVALAAAWVHALRGTDANRAHAPEATETWPEDADPELARDLGSLRGQLALDGLAADAGRGSTTRELQTLSQAAERMDRERMSLEAELRVHLLLVRCCEAVSKARGHTVPEVDAISQRHADAVKALMHPREFAKDAATKAYEVLKAGDAAGARSVAEQAQALLRVRAPRLDALAAVALMTEGRGDEAACRWEDLADATRDANPAVSAAATFFLGLTHVRRLDLGHAEDAFKRAAALFPEEPYGLAALDRVRKYQAAAVGTATSVQGTRPVSGER